MLHSAINRLLGAGHAPASDMLPPELQTVICSATILERSGVDESSIPRTLVMTACGSFHREGDDKQPRRWLAHNFPGLTEAQTLRALRLIDARVLEVQRDQVARDGGPRWAGWRPARTHADWS